MAPVPPSWSGAEQKASTSSQCRNQLLTAFFSTGPRAPEPSPLPWTTRTQRIPWEAQNATNSRMAACASIAVNPWRSSSSWRAIRPRRRSRKVRVLTPARLKLSCSPLSTSELPGSVDSISAITSFSSLRLDCARAGGGFLAMWRRRDRIGSAGPTASRNSELPSELLCLRSFVPICVQ